MPVPERIDGDTVFAHGFELMGREAAKVTPEITDESAAQAAVDPHDVAIEIVDRMALGEHLNWRLWDEVIEEITARRMAQKGDA